MMNDVAIQNIHNIVQDCITRGHNIIGVITVDTEGHIDLCWRTNDPTRASEWEQSLFRGCESGVKSRDVVPILKPQ